MEWWDNLSTYCQVLFIIACSTSVLFLIQLLMIVIGIGLDDMDIDTPDTADIDINDGDFFELFGLKLVTFRGIMAFFSIGSWLAYVVIAEWKGHVALGTCLGVVAGLIAMFLIAFIMKKAMKLEESGNIDINNAVGLVANVYLTIPKEKSGTGKVNVLVQERLVEYDAVTNDLDDIKTGQEVKIVDQKNNILVVTKL